MEEKVRAGERLSFNDGVALWNSSDLLGVGFLANIVRERLHGDATFFIHNRHINPTNICVYSCRFCAFGVKADDLTAYTKSLQEIFADASQYNRGSVSEFHIVGGLHPDLSFQYYLDMLSGLKKRFPEVHIQAFTAVELQYLAEISGAPFREALIQLRDAGLDSVPGGGAEIFAERVRKKSAARKLTRRNGLIFIALFIR